MTMHYRMIFAADEPSRMVKMVFIDPITGTEWMPKGTVFIGIDGRPYLLSRGWIHWWHPDKRWVTLQKDDGRVGCFIPLPPDQAAMYGVDSLMTFDHAKEPIPTDPQPVITEMP